MRFRANRVVGGMATMPSRSSVAPIAIGSALNNVDRLYLYLDEFDNVPEFAVHDRIEILRSQEYGSHKANGKFLGLAIDGNASHYMTFDDDYSYPSDFCARLLKACRSFGGRAAVGVHGSIFKKDVRSYVRDRRVILAWKHQWVGRQVDVLATMGTLHDTSLLRFDVRRWATTNMVDLNFAFELQKAGMTSRVVRRRRGWVTQLQSAGQDSIFYALKRDDTRQTALVNELLGR